MISEKIEQGTPEWLALKCGVPSASEFDKIVTTAGKSSKQREKYLYRLAGERITGCREEGYTNGAMERGAIVEAEARTLYEMIKGVEVEQVGVCYPNDDKAYLCSPDGLVGEDGGLEIKCPLMATHVSYLLDNVLPMDYFQQVQGSLLVTGRKWWDFVSHYPGIKPFIIRVERDEVFLKALQIELELFCKELIDITEKIRG